jgi:hypothetical protein
MLNLRRYRLVLLFAGSLIFCGLMVARQYKANDARHLELRESFILLHSRGYYPEAERLYQRLLVQVEHLPDRLLMEDFQRTLTLVDPAKQDSENLVWRYHWTVSNELEKRSESMLKRALKVAGEKE